MTEIRRSYRLAHTCGRAIGETAEGAFYDPEHEDAPLITCPGCGAILARDDLDMSKETALALARIYRRILDLDRLPAAEG